MRPIDADAALEKIKNPYQYREVAQWLNSQPTIKTLKPQWIPCNKRLPHIHATALVTTNKGNVMQAMYFGLNKQKHHTWLSAAGGLIYRDDEIIAWMPLPEPYKEDDAK